MKKLLFLLILPFYLFAQPSLDIKNFDYRRADSIALHFPKKKYKTVSTVAELLTQDIETEHEKFRAIFRWITDNIEYNKTAQNVADADKVVRKNKAVCQGFSNLLKEMCNVVNIPCEMITGYTKTESRDINSKQKKTDHAWNCVKLYGKWYLVDVTWATSKFNVVTHKFQKEFDDYYFLTPPEKFILDHYPAPPAKAQAQAILAQNNSKGNIKYYFQFLDKPVKRKEFASWPLYYPDFFHMQLTSIDPGKGAFSMKLEKPLHVELQADKPIKDAAILVNADRFVTPVLLKELGNGKYSFDYTFPDKGPKNLTIYANGQCVAEYLLKVK
jgi:hypothetical protein